MMYAYSVSTNRSITAGVFGSLALAVSASAQFTGATIEEIDLGAPEGFVTYRVVAHWASDAVFLAWGAFSGVGELIFFTGNGVDLLNDDSSPFFGSKQEDFAQFPIAAAWDSWVTVGATGFAGNNTDYSPGFIGSDGVTAAIVGNSFSEDADRFVYNSHPGNEVIGTDLVMAQFTLPERNGFHLEGVVAWSGAGAGINLSWFLVDQYVAPPCPWDLDCTGSVGASDLLSLLVSWGPCKGCPADFDGNGTVGASDLLALLVNWGPCP